MSSAICFNLDQSKILSSGNGLKLVLKTSDFTRCRILPVTFDLNPEIRRSKEETWVKFPYFQIQYEIKF